MYSCLAICYGEDMTQEPAATPDQLASTVGALRVVLGQLMRRLRQQGSVGDLTRSQSSVLARLERDGPATTSALARAEGIRPQSMGAIVSVLEAGGFVAGAPDPTDGRKTVLSLTDKTRAEVATGRLAQADWLLAAAQRELTPAEQTDLARCLKLLDRLARSP